MDFASVSFTKEKKKKEKKKPDDIVLGEARTRAIPSRTQAYPTRIGALEVGTVVVCKTYFYLYHYSLFFNFFPFPIVSFFSVSLDRGIEFT